MLLKQTAHREQISCQSGFTPLPLPNELWWKALFCLPLPFHPISHPNSPCKLSATRMLLFDGWTQQNHRIFDQGIRAEPPSCLPWQPGSALLHPNTANTGHVSDTRADHWQTISWQYPWLSPQRNNYKEKPQPAWNCYIKMTNHQLKELHTTIIQREKKIKTHPNI